MFSSKTLYKFFSDKKEQIIVISLSLFATILSSAKYFSHIFQIPKNNVFIGMSHYFEDFYYYLDQFYQGAHGGWLTYNNFTSESFKPTLIYFNNIILGKIGGYFGLEPFVTYNLSLIILKFTFLILCYLLIIKIFPKSKKLRLASFVLFLFATSFPIIEITKDGLVDLGPIIIFRVKNTFYTRFENIPGNYVQRIIFVIFLLFTSKYNELVRFHKIKLTGLVLFTVIFTILTLWLTLSDPVIGSLSVLIFFILMYILVKRNNGYFKYFFPLFVGICFGFITISIIMSKYITADPVYQNANLWDYNEYIKQFSLISLPGHIQAIGMLGVLFIIGTISLLIRKRDNVENVLLCLCYFPIFGFFVPYIFKITIPGFRFIMVTTYLFMSTVAVYGVLFIERILKKKIFYFIIILYLLISAISIYPVFLGEIAKVEGMAVHFTFMPKDLYEGLIVLRNLLPKNAIVLANAAADTDLYIPGITGKKVFTGHSLMNFNSVEKEKDVSKFYYEWTDASTALEFLKRNNIKYIIHTLYSNNFESHGLTSKYPFLKEIFRNNIIAIFTY